MLLIKAIAVVLVIYLLSLPAVGLIEAKSSLSISVNTILSTSFILDFLLVFFVSLIFDAVTSRNDFIYQDLLGGFVAAVLISMGLLPFDSVLLFAFIILCVSLYVCFIAGKIIYGIVVAANARRVLGAAIGVAVAFWIAFVILTSFPAVYNLLPQSLQPTGFNSTITYTTSPNSSIVNYTLFLINSDRHAYGLSNVTISGVESGQQHAISMLQGGYFSHWDTYGMKPYMRYTLLGGRGAVSENVAYVLSYSKECFFSECSNVSGIDIRTALKDMEYNMMYNDSVCCNNGHRDNILDPNHNQVSIGVAYSGKTAYLVEDFIDNYITWDNSSSGYGDGMVVLSGSVSGGFSLSQQSPIQMSYDYPVQNMSIAQLSNTSDYSYGAQIACVVSSSQYYCPGSYTITANEYSVSGNRFSIAFDIKSLIGKHGAGEYTVGIWLYNSSRQETFLGSTYTIFINSTGGEYFPRNI